MRNILISPFIALIYIYKYVISPVLPGGCRHYPTCSSYAIDALKIHGLSKGALMASARIARCHPWGTHGYDPVPLFFFKKINIKKLDPGKNRKYPSCDRLKPY